MPMLASGPGAALSLRSLLFTLGGSLMVEIPILSGMMILLLAPLVLDANKLPVQRQWGRKQIIQNACTIFRHVHMNLEVLWIYMHISKHGCDTVENTARCLGSQFEDFT